MRDVTIVISPTDEYMEDVRSRSPKRVQGNGDPREVWIDGTLVATQEAVHYVNLLNDGTVVGIAQFRGDADRLTTIEDESPEIISCTVTGGETWLAYLHYEPEEFETALYERIDTEAVSIDWPVVETADGLRLTLFGKDAALRELTTDIPEELDVTLKRAGEYQPDMDDPAEQLTARQKEIARAALAAGYYDIPRRATQRDLAADLGVSRGTIGDHLRRIEAKIIQSVVV